MSQRRPDSPAEQLLVAAVYALVIAAVSIGLVSPFSDDLGLLATAVLWAALVPVCLACVLVRARTGGIRALSRRR